MSKYKTWPHHSADEVHIYNRVLPAAEVVQRFNMVPNMKPNQPLVPTGDSFDWVSGQIAQSTGSIAALYNFKFQAIDLQADDLTYIIDWDCDPSSPTYVSSNTRTINGIASGQLLEARNSWTQVGTHYIRAMVINAEGNQSDWGPWLGIILDVPISTKVDQLMLIGANAGVCFTDSNVFTGTVGEHIGGYSITANYVLNAGYQGPICDKSLWWDILVGQSAPGGTETMPPAKVSVSSFVNSSDKSTIVNGLRQNAGVTLKDNNGNSRLTNGRWIQYDYDNRPIRIITEDGTETVMSYDYEGQRITKAVMPVGGTTDFKTLYVGTIFEENYIENNYANPASTGTTKYIYAGSQRVAMLSSGDTNYFLPDHLGSTDKITDNSGTVVRTTTYSPFGATYSSVGTKDDEHKYTGQVSDDNTGLYYYNARYYDPQLGTFLTPDTLVQDPYDPQTLNRYAYCRNNPIIYTDPSGHIFGIDDILIGMAIGAAMGGSSGHLLDGHGGAWNWGGMIQGAAVGGIGAGFAELGAGLGGNLAAGTFHSAVNSFGYNVVSWGMGGGFANASVYMMTAQNPTAGGFLSAFGQGAVVGMGMAVAREVIFGHPNSNYNQPKEVQANEAKAGLSPDNIKQMTDNVDKSPNYWVNNKLDLSNVDEFQLMDYYNDASGVATSHADTDYEFGLRFGDGNHLEWNFDENLDIHAVNHLDWSGNTLVHAGFEYPLYGKGYYFGMMPELNK